MRTFRTVTAKLPLMLNCREAEEFIHDYIEGTLRTKQRVIFRLHLMLCSDCRNYLAAYRYTVALGKAVFSEPGDPLSEDVPEKLVKAILAARKV